MVNHASPKINRLVYCEDRLDVTAGAYPFGDTSTRRKMAWIFDQYNHARFEGKIPGLDADGMRGIIEAVSSRITEHVVNEGEELPLEGQYERIGGGPGWAFTRETGGAARLAMFNDGVNAFVVHVLDKGDGSHVYVYGKKPWAPFDLRRLYQTLNRVDKSMAIDTGNKHGGSDIIGGSPRMTGSRIAPDELERIINDPKNRILL